VSAGKRKIGQALGLGCEKKMPGKEEWVEVFRASIGEFKRRAAGDATVADAAALAEKFAANYNAALDLVLDGDHAGLFDGPPTVLKQGLYTPSTLFKQHLFASSVSPRWPASPRRSS